MKNAVSKLAHVVRFCSAVALLQLAPACGGQEQDSQVDDGSNQSAAAQEPEATAEAQSALKPLVWWSNSDAQYTTLQQCPADTVYGKKIGDKCVQPGRRITGCNPYTTYQLGRCTGTCAFGAPTGTRVEPWRCSGYSVPGTFSCRWESWPNPAVYLQSLTCHR
jgi:hypothetical protein